MNRVLSMLPRGSAKSLGDLLRMSPDQLSKRRHGTVPFTWEQAGAAADWIEDNSDLRLPAGWPLVPYRKYSDSD